MVSSKETTAAGYLASLPPERRAVIAKVRTLIRKHLPKGYVEAMNWGMLCYEVPFSTFPDTYNKQPLCYIGLVAQKNNYAIHLMNVSDHTPLHRKLIAAYKASGTRLDMGKCCLRFHDLDNLPMDVIAEIVASTPVETMIALHEKQHPKKMAATGR